MNNFLLNQALSQYEELSHDILPKIVQKKEKEVSKIEKDDQKKIFLYLYVVWYFSNRNELKNYLKDDYFIYSCSFIYEAYISFILNQQTAVSLLLRSSMENFLKFLLHHYGLDIDPTRFKSNASKLRKKITNENSRRRIDRLVTIYGNISSISHSANGEKIDIIKFFSSTIISSENICEKTSINFKRILMVYDYFILTLCKDSLKKWDTPDLANILNVSFKPNKVQSIVACLKHGTHSDQ